ncbi:MAG: hypothetical protein ACK4GN_00345 [Runella sp.]
MKTPWIEATVGWLSLGFLVIWVLEFRRTDFQNSYWALMLFLSCLLGFLLLRKSRNARPVLTDYTPENRALKKGQKAKVKPSKTKK